MDHSAQFLKLVKEAKGHVKETTVADVQRRQAAGEKMELVDVREESEFAAGHAKDARHLSKGVIERDIAQAIPDAHAKIILYCGGGFRSALAAENLQRMGYTNVESMDGGWRAWVEAGMPTSKG
jgi:rhodanese-related sulfurtransferase